MARGCAIHSGTMAAALFGLALAGGGAGRAEASEGGASFYLLGTGGPGAAVMPPVKGVFFDNQLYIYSGSAGGGKSFPLGGRVVADLKANITADFASVATVPSTHFLGGVFMVGGALPIGGVTVDVSSVLSGPLGNQINASTSDSTFVVGDPIATAAQGWKFDKFNLQLSDTLNIPIGQYRHPGLANLAFHRWVNDVSLAGTWHDDKAGWDVSSKAGVTFNGTNPATHYYTGTEFHIEGAIEKTFTPAWSAGVQAYYFYQLTNDGGPLGDALGGFRGEVTGVGGTAAYHFALFKKPATLRLRVMTEFDARNRLQGTQGVFDLSFPLVLHLPAG